MITGVHDELRSRGDRRPEAARATAAGPRGGAATTWPRPPRNAWRSSARAAASAPSPNASCPSGHWRCCGRRERSRAWKSCRRWRRKAGRRLSPPTGRRSTRRSRGSPRRARAASPTATWRELLELFSARFEAAKERRAGIDFEDLQILAARLLERAEIGEQLPLALPPDPRRRVPGHQPAAAAADRGAARAEDRAGRGRRRAAVDLRVPPRRPRGLPPPARGDRPPRRRRADATERQLPLAAGGDRGGQPLRRGAVRRRLHAAAGGRRLASHARGHRFETSRAAAHRPRRLGCRGNRAGAGDRRLDAAQLPGRGAVRRRAAARAGRGRGAARGDGRAAARLHPPRRLRGLARTRRPAALCGRRPRLLVPTAGRRRLGPAGGPRQPPRRPRPLRRPRLPRLRGRPGHALAAADGCRQAAPRLARGGARSRPRRGRADGAGAAGGDPGERARTARALRRHDRLAARAGAAALAAGPGRGGGDGDRVRPGGAEPAGRRGPFRQRPQDGAGSRPSSSPARGAICAACSTSSPPGPRATPRPRPRPPPRATTGCGS